MHISLLGVLILFSVQASALKVLPVLYQWKGLAFGFHSKADRDHAIKSGHYNRSNPGLPIDVGVTYKNQTRRVFLTIPRFLIDSPYSLATVSSRHNKNGPIINPYPSYQWHNNDNKNCSGITSAFRIAINECNQMWVIDSGFVKGSQICPPQLLVFDLNTNNLVHRYQFPENLYVANASLCMNVILDVADPPPIGKCQKTMVYVSDSLFHGLIVYDPTKGDAWRVENRYMYPDPKWGRHSINGVKFVQMGGIFAINLSPRKSDSTLDDRYLYYHAWASNKELKVDLKYLNNKTIWEEQVDAMDEVFHIINHRDRQSIMEVMDSQGNLYSSTDDPLVVFVWNTNKLDSTYNTKSVVANDKEQLEFISGMKSITSPAGEESIYFLSSRYQVFRANAFDWTDYNFRIMTQTTKKLLSCAEQ